MVRGKGSNKMTEKNKNQGVPRGTSVTTGGNKMKKFYVNAYIVSQQYGGPEEGGWWTNAYKPLSIVSKRREDGKPLQKRNVSWECDTEEEALENLEYFYSVAKDYAHNEGYRNWGGRPCDIDVKVESHRGTYHCYPERYS